MLPSILTWSLYFHVIAFTFLLAYMIVHINNHIKFMFHIWLSLVNSNKHKAYFHKLIFQTHTIHRVITYNTYGYNTHHMTFYNITTVTKSLTLLLMHSWLSESQRFIIWTFDLTSYIHVIIVDYTNDTIYISYSRCNKHTTTWSSSYMHTPNIFNSVHSSNIILQLTPWPMLNNPTSF